MGPYTKERIPGPLYLSLIFGYNKRNLENIVAMFKQLRYNLYKDLVVNRVWTLEEDLSLGPYGRNETKEYSRIRVNPLEKHER